MFINFTQFFKERKAWKQSNLSNQDFCKEYQSKLQNKKLACSFVPERLRDWGFSEKQILQVLHYTIKNLKVTNFRLGIRMTEVDFKNESLGFYKKILDIMLGNNCQVVLNLGPIKYIAWPEYFFRPETFSKISKIPKVGYEIKAGHEISDLTLIDLEMVMKIICKTYTKNQLKNVIALQPDNEFRNPFGSYKWLFHNSHELKVCDIFEKYLPNRKLLIDCAGMWDIGQHIEFVNRYPKNSNIIFGLNYYFLEPNRGPFWWQKAVDRFVLSTSLKGISLDEFFKVQKKYGFATEITELQMDPWGRANLPGNSVEALKFAIIRCLEYTGPTNGQIRLWGIEHLVSNILFNKPTLEHLMMSELISMLNNNG